MKFFFFNSEHLSCVKYKNSESAKRIVISRGVTMANHRQINKLSAKAVFLTGLTKIGNEILEFFPEIDYCEDLDKELCLKSMPMGGKDGDSIVTKIDNQQAVCIMRSIPDIEDSQNLHSMFVSLGLLIPLRVNPIPYQDILTKLTDTCKENGMLNKETLTRIVPNLYHVLNRTKGFD